VVAGAPGGVPYQAMRADGNTLFASTEQSAVVIRDVLSPHPTPWEIPEPTGIAKLLPFPDGTRAIVLAGDGTARVWTIGAATADLELAGPGGAQVLAVGLDPDGSRVGWITREEPGRAALHLRDLAAGTTSSYSLEMAVDDVRLQLTRDPSLVAIGVFGQDIPWTVGPDRAWTVHSLGNAVPERTHPTGTTVHSGDLTATCAEGGQGEGLEQAQLVVRDLLTGAERHRVEQHLSTSCASLAYSLEGRYAIDPFSSIADPASVEVIRITDLATGVSYQAAAPPLDSTAWPPGSAPTVTALPDGRGGLVAFVAVGPTVVRVPAEREVAFDPDFGTTLLDVPGGLLTIQGAPPAGTSSFTTYDPVSGQQIASLVDVPAVFGSGWSVGDVLLTFGQGPQGWQLDRYELPTLTRTFSAHPHGGPTSRTTTAAATTDSDGRIVITSVNSSLSAWDVHTGQQLGDPVGVSDHGNIWARPDRPGEVFVSTTAGLELWDIPAGRRLATFDTEEAGEVASRGNLLVHLTDGQLGLWDIATQERRATIPTPDLGSLTGFRSDGILVAENTLRGVVVFWDLERLVQVGSVRPSEEGIDGLFGDALLVSGRGARMPLLLGGTPEQWHQHLCQVLPTDVSPAARDLLPPGTDPSTGCQ
jgi:hypothetical protein